MIRLKKNADKRARKGHLWVFSNEIADPPVGDLEAGSIHELTDHQGEFLGVVYVNPKSLIAARILSHKKVPIDGDFIRQRLEAAFERRKRLFPDREAYRIVFSDSDLLPGLIVDRYGSFLVVQSLTAGMDQLIDLVVEVLADVLKPDGIYLRNDAPARSLEGIGQEKRPAFGSVPELVTTQFEGGRFAVDISGGQKTGFFLDQEANRPLMKRFVHPGAIVLDLFSYSGAWGIHAALAGASEVVAVDSSRGALDLAEQNATLNGVQDRFQTVRDGVLDYLKKASRIWDVIVLDPPAFVKSRSQVAEGRKGYIDVNRRALNHLNAGGILVTCSCSHHVDLVTFEEILLSASRQSGRDLRILDVRGQGPDHPVLLAMPESRYLKVIVAQVV